MSVTHGPKVPLGGGTPIVPVVQGTLGEEQSLPCVIPPGETLQLDWGRKRTGYVYLTGEGEVRFLYASNAAMFALQDQKTYFTFPSFVGADATGSLILTETPRPLHKTTVPLRYLQLSNRGATPVILKGAVLEPSEFPQRPLGRFVCSDETLNRAWQMGIDTVHLCTQRGEHSQIPVFAPFGEGYVQWDGCRRDREIWGGDLRPGALAWLYNFTDASPIANSLYVLISGQHIDCSEHGLFPGSGSSGQKYYEWAFWEVVCLYEYLLHTGDERLFGPARYSLPMFLQWCERKLSEYTDGWIHTDRSWMYTVQFGKQALPALQVVAILGLRALVQLFTLLGLEEYVPRAVSLERQLSRRFHQQFWKEDQKAYCFGTLADGLFRSDLCTNSWALLADLVPQELVPRLLGSLKEGHWTAVGSVNLHPSLGEFSPHDRTVWPYANGYEVAARFHVQDAAGALEVIRRCIAGVQKTGQETYPEMFYLDGTLPFLPDGTVLSFCHAWASQVSWALQRYLLGIYPVKMAWRKFAVNPVPSDVEWVSGAVVTPLGEIEITLEGTRGKVVYPKGLEYVQPSGGYRIEFQSRD